MAVIFNTIFPDEIKMPAQNIQALLDSYRERQKTGVVRLGYASDKRLCFLFKRGEQVNTYLVTPEKWESLSPEHGAQWALSAGDAYAKSIPLSSFGLLTTKLLTQSRAATTEVFAGQKQLEEYLASLGGRDEAVLAHLTWKNAAGAIFFAPRSAPRFSFVSQDIVLDETGNYKVLNEWDDPQCAVTVFPPDLSVEAWQEYYLRSAFANIHRDSFARFEILTGRALVDSLARLVAVFISRQNLDISVTIRKLEDNEVFSSPQDAAQTYRLLLGEMFDHFSAVIGPRLHASTLRDIMKNLPAREHEIAHTFELLPQGYVYE